MYNTILLHFWFPNMRPSIEQHVKTCHICQRIKSPFPKLGKLPPKYNESNPLQVDLVGPWQFKLHPKWKVSVLAVTAMIDPFSGLCEILCVKNKTCFHISTGFFQMWLAIYPRPLCCIHDNGSKFIAQEFQDLLKHYGIQDVRTTAKNPHANSIIERMHLTISSMLHFMLHSMIADAQQNGQLSLLEKKGLISSMKSLQGDVIEINLMDPE